MKQLKCPKCAQVFHANDFQAEPVISCPECGQKLRLPTTPASLSSEPAESLATTIQASVSPPPLPPAAAPRYDAVPYRADQGFGLIGVGFVLATMFVAGVLLGFIASLIGQWFYLILLFPIGVGMALFGVEHWAIKVGKVRNPILGAFTGFFAACVTMTSMHYFDYVRFQRDLAGVPAPMLDLAEHLAVLPPGAPAELRAIWPWLHQAAQVHTFPDFVDFSAHQGVSIKSSHEVGKKEGMNLGYVGTYIYWIVEILIVAVLALLGGHGAAAKPFCRQCHTWKVQRQLAVLKASKTGAAAALQDGDVAELLTQEPDPRLPDLVLTAGVCPSCRHETTVDLLLTHVYKDKKGNRKTEEITHVTYPGEALPVLELLTTPMVTAAGR